MTRNLRFSFPVFPVALAAFMLVGIGCSSTPTDSQLTAQVQKQIADDSALQGQPIAVSADHGTVTLSGSVRGQSSRELASRDASKVKGVRQLVNNLSVGTNPNSGTAAMNDQSTQGNSASSAAEQAPAPEAAPAPSSGAASAPSPGPAQPQAIVIPAGTRIRVQLSQTLSTKTSQSGEPFSGTLADPVRVNGQTIIRAGAQARGIVLQSQSPGRFKGQGALAVRLDSVRADGRSYPVRTSHVERVEQGKGKRSAVMTGGGAGLGAIIGGVAGGGKGALLGGLLGGGGGAAGSAFTGNKDIVLPAESILTFDLEKSVTVHR